MAFDRWNSQDQYSYVYRLFAKHHTHMNSLYWAHVPASSFCLGTSRRELKETNPKTTQQLLHVSGANAFRVNDDVKGFSSDLNEFDNWTRLNTLVAVLSYFETYLSSVVSLAIESDLGLLYSIPKRIDGAMVLKHNNTSKYAFFDKSESITKGDWSKRAGEFKSLFGAVPQSITDNISSLERMRKLRNNVAHAFGRDIDETRARTTMELLPMERLTEKTLLKYMELILNIAKDVDIQLFSNHIGEYELVHYYHVNKGKFSGPNEVRDFKDSINKLYINLRGNQFCRELIAYYNNIA
ncbi:hypothetical protein [Photobacterium leiognathi]|uniref:hypothetical protein n=1 Tax=Photobacterium leiognathi TaxID=553611 RepID=UPI00273A56A5|nr:hypothetical protein [Photobacterium leiognathi]